MKRIFKLFIKEKQIKKVSSLSQLTIDFNHWVSSSILEGTKSIQRFQFKAYTNKHIIRKWSKSFLVFQPDRDFK